MVFGMGQIGGTKYYSIVLFRSDKKPKSNVMNEARSRKMAKKKPLISVPNSA